MINKVRPMINESSPTILGPAPNYSEELSKSNEGVAKYCAERPKTDETSSRSFFNKHRASAPMFAHKTIDAPRLFQRRSHIILAWPKLKIVTQRDRERSQRRPVIKRRERSVVQGRE
jgi:hypothetical protein